MRGWADQAVERRRAGALTRFGLVAFLLLGVGTELEAQVPDTVPVPSEPVPGDAVLVPIPPEAVSPDTTPQALADAAAAPTPALALPRFPAFGGVGWDVGRWEWTAEELARLPGMTVLEFVETVPGMAVFRLGGFGRPEGLSALGVGGGRVRVFIDGFELDPHGSASYPLQMLSVIDLRRLRVERTMSGIVVHIDTFVLDEPQPVSTVALGTGVYQTRLLRGLFSRGFGTRSVATGSFDLASTGGIAIGERYRHLNAALRWDYVRSDRFGLQAEWRRTVVDRAGETAPLATTRGDLILRARAAPTERLSLEGYVGRSGADEDAPTAGPLSVGVVQAGAAAAFAGERLFGEVRTRGRMKGEPSLAAPSVEIEGRLGFRPLSFVRLEGSSSLARGASKTATRTGLSASVYPVPMLALFGSVETGSAFVASLVDRALTEEDEPQYDFDRLVTDVGGQRAGLELAGGFGSIGAAAFRTAATDIAPFGLSFDRGWPIEGADEATGAEVYFRLPIPLTRGFAVDGWYSRFVDASERLYAPDDMGRIALTFHDAFIGGQLEPSFRLEGIYRGTTPVPAAPGTDILQIMPAFQTLNFSLQFRIIDVTAFLIWDNVLANQQAVSLPGTPVSAPRIVYGGSWRFTN